MQNLIRPWQLLIVILTALFTREQQQVIEYLIAENQVLRELAMQNRKRLLLSDDQRRRLAVKGNVLGRKRLSQIKTLFSPNTILRWHRQLVARKWDYADKRTNSGRPKIDPEIAKLVLQFAKENPSWGYDRIQGALANLGHKVSDQTVGNILKANGIEPAPDRKRTGSWLAFIKAHWDVLASVDFTTVEVWTPRGLITYYLLFVMELKTRRVHFAGCTVAPDTAYMQQIARNLTDCDEGFLNDKKYLIMDRDTKFCEAFRSILESSNVEPVRLPARSPNLNAHIERFFGSLKSECLGKMIFFGERSLQNAVTQYLRHYHAERNHQGLENRLIDPGDEAAQAVDANPAFPIRCRERLGGMLRHYRRAA